MANFLKRMKDSLSYTVLGVKPETWMTPGQPIQPAAQETEGRQFDFPVGYNINTRPIELDKFKQLRLLANNCDILRSVIETRKDQVSRFRFSFKLSEDHSVLDDYRCKELNAFFKSPNKINTWDEWLRALLEDMFVIDAASVYVHKTLGGQVYSLDLIDGSTIKKIIDQNGRTPIDGVSPAYQQILKGIPAVDYTYNEIIYKPRNVRTNQIYGFSPVEQIITTVNSQIRKQLQQLSYFTEGNTPNLIFTTPDSWQPNQIKQFQILWDELNNSGSKHNAKFVPAGVVPYNTKPEPLKNEFDEWLARIICYNFNVSSQPFIKEMNRATAETANETATSEGLFPILNWVKNFIDFIVINHFGYTDIEFVWNLEKEEDPLKKAQIDDIYLKNGVKKINEVRKELSLDPIDETVVEDTQVNTATKYTKINCGDSNIKKKTSINNLKSFNKKHLEKSALKLKKIINKYLSLQSNNIIEQIIKQYSKIKKADEVIITAQVILDLIKLDGVDTDVILEDIEFELNSILSTSGIDALKLINKDNEETINNIKDIAIKNAKERANSLLNEEADMNIVTGMMMGLNPIITEAIDNGWSNDELSKSLQEAYAFSSDRADMIARTETNRADNVATLSGYRVGGVEKKAWLTAQDDLVSDECQANEDQGPIGIDEDFISGTDAPPSHPNCRCTLIAVFD